MEHLRSTQSDTEFNQTLADEAITYIYHASVHKDAAHKGNRNREKFN